MIQDPELTVQVTYPRESRERSAWRQDWGAELTQTITNTVDRSASAPVPEADAVAVVEAIASPFPRGRLGSQGSLPIGASRPLPVLSQTAWPLGRGHVVRPTLFRPGFLGECHSSCCSLLWRLPHLGAPPHQLRCGGKRATPRRPPGWRCRSAQVPRGWHGPGARERRRLTVSRSRRIRNSVQTRATARSVR